jgi:hypothetical protein
MNQALYAHMNNKRKMKKKRDLQVKATSLQDFQQLGHHSFP